MELPRVLVEEVRSGRVVLVMGAGASVGALTSEGKPTLSGPALARLLADRFLGGEHNRDPLPNVSELAISEGGLGAVQEFIRSKFQDLQPTPFHMLLPTFKWAGLATTNFDLLIEKTYSRCQDRAQELVPLIKNGDHIEEKMRSPRSIMYLKLHGCISRTTDESVPLILSVEQHQTHMKSRDRVFDHLKGLSFENTLVFVGHRLHDPDIRLLLHSINDTEQRPRYFSVTPKVSGPQARFWERERITTLEGTFEDFLKTLDAEIASPFRGIVLKTKVGELPISSRFNVVNPELSSNCVDFFENDVDYVRDGMKIESVDPTHFYRGYSPPWSAIDKNLDVRRDIEEEILLETVLSDDTDNVCRVCAIKGHAGSGKSTLLQRVAWEAAHEFQKLCLLVRPHREVSFGPIKELSMVIDERIYLFIDDVNECVPETGRLIKEAQRHSMAVTIVVSARINEWNMSCEEIEPYVLDEFEVRYLSRREVIQLLGLLQSHNSLFRLENVSHDERMVAFEEKAGMQLLVALHEATLGKPFEDIIASEFSKVVPDQARHMYLGICFLNRFGVPVRAGLISRIYGIRLTDFKERFFYPLEGLVFTQEDFRSNDYVYRTRHQHIAEIVVSRALQQRNDKFRMYLEVISNMNVDYASDRKAFGLLIRGRSLLEEFPDHQMSQQVYLAARMKVGEDPHLLHQMAIYEMNRPNGSYEQATDYLARARELAPHDRSITHSLAELHLKRAESSESSLRFQKHIRDAEHLASSLTGNNAATPHGYHTLAKAYIAKLKRSMAPLSNGATEFELSQLARNAEDTIQRGLQKFPNDPYLLSAESELGGLLLDDDRAIKALETAFSNNPSEPFIATRLAKLLAARGRVEEALMVYKTAINSGVFDKHLHFGYAKLMIDYGLENGQEIEYQLRRAFTEGDSNLEAQFWYARQLYVNDKPSEAAARFSRLKSIALNPAIKREIRGILRSNGIAILFSGSVDQLSYDHGFVVRDGAGDRVFLHIGNSDPVAWEQLERNSRISFKIGFNFWGATAVDIQLE